MTQYAIYFNQQWVGDHSEEWFRSRGPLSRAVLEEMKAAGVYVFGGGLVEEIDEAVTADDTSGALVFTPGQSLTAPSGSAASPSSTSLTRTRRGCGPERSPSAAAGRRSCAGSSRRPCAP